jgi:predicted Zn-dependent protease with MMP-like domain
MARKLIGKSWAPVVSARTRSRQRFEELVANALDDLPEMIRSQMDNVVVVVEEEPGEDLYGLYQGVPQTQRDGNYSGILPDMITIYRGPLERAAGTNEELAKEVRITVLHEVAHHFGIDDDRLHELGWG